MSDAFGTYNNNNNNNNNNIYIVLYPFSSIALYSRKVTISYFTVIVEAKNVTNLNISQLLLTITVKIQVRTMTNANLKL